MSNRDLVLVQASIDNGRIYFPPEAMAFFPADSFGDRAGEGHKGNPVLFRGAGLAFETDIRISSSKRLSPRCSLASFLVYVGARAGGMLRIKRTAEREYQLYYLG